MNAPRQGEARASARDESAANAPRQGVSLEVTELAYHYPDGSPALRGASFSVAAGERVALLGPNGAGKSTLLLHLAGLLPERHRYLHEHGPQAAPHRHDASARIVVDGIALRRGSIRHVRDRVGIVFEDPDDQLFGLTVGEDVGYGPRARAWPEERVAAAVRRALDAVGLTGFEPRTPHHLSAGEKRRACIAGALACEPGLLLLDEPSSGIDPRGRRELTELLAGLRATLLVASHDLEFVRGLCSRALVLDQGRVVADGAIESLLSDRAFLLQHGLA
jgi:cobalt/nickel transport system ATP-binding protein